MELRDDTWAHLKGRVDHRQPLNRLCYAAAHVVMDESYRSVNHTVENPGSAAEIAEHVDWATTLSIRSKIAAAGMGIAEAMDTAQRFSLGWDSARELIAQTGKLGVPFCAGASTDHLGLIETKSQLIDGVCEQIEIIRQAGGVPVILPMPLLPDLQAGADQYVEVYTEIARTCSDGPLIVHWLGPMFLPALEGYFPEDSFERVMRSDPAKFRAAKLSMLDADLETRLRSVLLENDQIMLTGDDFHFGELIGGSGDSIKTTELAGQTVELGEFSHALLGIFDALSEPASLALRLLEQGDRASYDEIMSRCEALGQCIFEQPTRFYKTGLTFLSWLNGHQENFMLVNHEEECREPDHLLKVAQLASEAGAITDAVLANQRLAEWLQED